MKVLPNLKKSLVKVSSLVFLLPSLLFGRTTDLKPGPSPSVRDRIAAVQKAALQLPERTRQPHLLTAQWGNWLNWANWANWNNWGNWANWNNWNNWGNWLNY